MYEQKKPNTDSLNIQVYLYIRNKILSNQLSPGERINYEEIASEIGSSITPVRDAVNWLSKDGLIEIKARSGAYVKKVEYEDLEEIIQLRRALEREAVGLAIEHIPTRLLNDLLEKMNAVQQQGFEHKEELFFQYDRELHGMISEYCKNKRISELLNTLQAQITRIATIVLKDNVRFVIANKNHIEIIEALLARDKQLAQLKMEEHISEVGNALKTDFYKK